MSEDRPLYVAVFREHPLGPRRFTKDFKYNLTLHNKAWWGPASDQKRREHFAWALNHEQYHYSTDDIRKADMWYLDSSDAEDRAILEQYAPVDYIEVELVYSEKDEQGWQTFWMQEKNT